MSVIVPVGSGGRFAENLSPTIHYGPLRSISEPNCMSLDSAPEVFYSVLLSQHATLPTDILYVPCI